MEIGDCKYLANGQEVRVVKELPDGALVQKIYENDGDEWAEDHIFFVEKIYEHAPTEKQDARLTKLRTEIDGLYKIRADLLQEIDTAKKSEGERLKKYKRYEALRHLDDFLDGKITHYATKTYTSWGVEDINIAKKNKYDRGNTKLLCLHGRSNGDLEWHLYEYSDGSGGSHEAFPYRSYEEALERVRRELGAMEEINQYDVKSAEKYGAALNPAALLKYRERKRKDLAETIEAKRSELDKAVQKFTEFDVAEQSI